MGSNNERNSFCVFLAVSSASFTGNNDTSPETYVDVIRVQLSDQWVDHVLSNLDCSDARNTVILDKIESARVTGTLMKGVAGLDNKTGEFSVVKLAEGY